MYWHAKPNTKCYTKFCAKIQQIKQTAKKNREKIKKKYEKLLPYKVAQKKQTLAASRQRWVEPLTLWGNVESGMLLNKFAAAIPVDGTTAANPFGHAREHDFVCSSKAFHVLIRQFVGPCITCMAPSPLVSKATIANNDDDHVRHLILDTYYVYEHVEVAVDVTTGNKAFAVKKFIYVMKHVRSHRSEKIY